MAASDLSINVILDYFLEKGGIVSNRDVVKHFKRYLTDPSTKDEARTNFKKYINMLAITKTEGDEKFLILKPKYCPDAGPAIPAQPCLDPINSIGIPLSPVHSVQELQTRTSLNARQPPPYRPPPPPPPPPSAGSTDVSCDNISISSSNMSLQEAPPQVPPRRRNSEKGKSDVENESDEHQEQENQNAESDKQPVSVKERTQKFNRMASVEDELSPRPQKEKKKTPEKGADEDDGASVTSLDQKKCTEWLVTAAKGDYQELAKLAADEPRLVKLKDPFTAYTVLHWAAKHGNEDIIKLFAGKYRADVNSRTNGGYTPLHMAVQFGHTKVYELMTQVYSANPNIRDFSGRKPNQYNISKTQTANKDTYSEYRMPHQAKNDSRSIKHQSFLRKNFTPTQRRNKSAHEVPSTISSRF